MYMYLYAQAVCRKKN